MCPAWGNKPPEKQTKLQGFLNILLKIRTFINDTILISIEPKMETKIRIIDALDKNKKGIHIRELERLIKTSYANTVRNITILEKENAIQKEKDANLVKIKLKNNPLTIAYLKQAHTENYLKLPKKVINAIQEFLTELPEKPLITLLFGSFAKKTHMDNSDIDILLVFQKINNQATIENTAKRVSMKTNTQISPVYIEYGHFEKNFFGGHTRG